MFPEPAHATLGRRFLYRSKMMLNCGHSWSGHHAIRLSVDQNCKEIARWPTFARLSENCLTIYRGTNSASNLLPDFSWRATPCGQSINRFWPPPSPPNRWSCWNSRHIPAHRKWVGI